MALPGPASSHVALDKPASNESLRFLRISRMNKSPLLVPRAALASFLPLGHRLKPITSPASSYSRQTHLFPNPLPLWDFLTPLLLMLSEEKPKIANIHTPRLEI